MPRSTRIRHVSLAGLTFVVLTLPVRAGQIPADALPLPNRVGTADLVVAGKVTAIEDKTVMATAFPGATNKTEYTVAVVTLSDALPAPKGVMTIRLGFVPIPPMVAISPRPLQPTVGMEGIFFLKKLGETDLYTAHGQLDFLDKKSPAFEKDLALVKRCLTILDEPNGALKGTSAEDRFLAAALLLARYRTRKSPNAATEAIDAEQSKLILEALAAADWAPPTDFTQLSPLMVLGRLSLTEKDGWMPPNDRKAYAVYAQQWLKDHAGTYRIQKFVPEKNK